MDSSLAVPNLPTYTMFTSGPEDLGMLYFMIVIIIFVLTMCNAFSVYAITGGHIYNLAFYSSMTLVISGFALVLIPPLVNMLFTSIM